MRAKHIDANQPTIVLMLRKVPGVSVAITSDLGDGFPDIVVGYRGRNFMFEIKDPEQDLNKRKLNTKQLMFHKAWDGQIDKVETFTSILKIINGGR